MNCQQFAHQLGAEPANLSATMQAHMVQCEPCARLSAELGQFDEILQAALHVDVPDSLGTHDKLTDNVIALNQPATSTAVSKRPQWFALAAVLILGLGISVGTWYERATAPLQKSLIAHVLHEPNLLLAEWQAEPVANVEQVLKDGRVSLNGDIGTVRHAGLCSFRGHKVAHVVVQTESGPVTLMLLPDESVQSTQSFSEDGYNGVLVPVGTGSIAIIGNDSEAMIKVRERVADKVTWSI